jgi:hypothetical protein
LDDVFCVRFVFYQAQCGSPQPRPKCLHADVVLVKYRGVHGIMASLY